MSDSVRAGIVVTGSELLTGAVADRNGPWLAERLGALGIEVSDILLVGDRRADLTSALEFLRGGAVDLIVTSGGLGPTADDVTAEVIADFAGLDMVLDSDMEQYIARRLEKWARNYDLDPDALVTANRKQATVPRGATLIDPAGTAPGLVVSISERPVVVVLPGPPRELQRMWEPALDTAPMRELLARSGSFTATHLRMFGLPESEIAQTLRDVGAETDLSGIEITTCQRRSELELDLRYRTDADNRAELDGARDQLIAEIERRHGRTIVSRDGTSSDEQVAQLLSGRTIGLGESCTAGMLASRLADRPGSSAYLLGGVVAYSNAAKTALLGVPAELIEQHGAVSTQVARAMADGARATFGADVGVGITGVAGPSGGTEAKPVGYVCLCVTTSEGVVRDLDRVFPGDRTDIRERASDFGLNLIRRALSTSTEKAPE